MFCCRGFRLTERCKPPEPKRESTAVAVYMNTELELALRERAEHEGISVSKLVREIIQKEARKWRSTKAL